MSPKSRSRRPRSAGGRQRRSGSPRPTSIAQEAFKAARALVDSADPFDPWAWASLWTGLAWATAAPTDRDGEHRFVRELCALATPRRAPQAEAALRALALVAGQDDRALIEQTLAATAGDRPAPPWAGGTDWSVVGATTTADVWHESRILIIHLTGAAQIGLVVSIDDSAGHIIESIAPMPESALQAHLTELAEDVESEAPQQLAVDDALAELAEALQFTDMLWPRQSTQHYAAFRALAWTVARDHLRPPREWVEISDGTRAELTAAFAASLPAGDTVSASFADLFIDYADGYFRGGDVLAWGPKRTENFMLDYVPRKVVLEHEDVEHLPGALRAWVRFALARRGLGAAAEKPVLDAIEDATEDYREAMDDTGNWGVGKQFAAFLGQEGIDLTDPTGLDEAMSSFNAQQLARRAAGLED